AHRPAVAAGVDDRGIDRRGDCLLVAVALRGRYCNLQRRAVNVISIVIPVYNEKDSLALLHGEIVQSAQRASLDLEVVFVDDGSTAGSWQVIMELAAEHPDVKGIRFRRNFGKAAALSAGFRAARGDIILTLDADLQDDPAEIPRFLEALGQGRDVVSGWKRK